ncbi:MAG TPA: SdrD B-like domain-containing protein [Gaiellales bacterium]|jgi:uncharacterized repeat protein (TIGR01451 family)|nr:SdrD B-like domain-containing protein [Gaiellales bacterium]
MRRALLLLVAVSGLLVVPALASAHPDLSLVKVVDHAQAAPGDLLTYTILVENHGTQANAPGTVTDTLPAHTTFVSASSGCTAAAAVITCPVAPLAVGASVTYTITVRVDDDVPAGDLVNVADVAAPGDRPTTNNHGEATSTVGFAGLGDYVWWDQNHDGLQTAGEPGFAGVTVRLYNASGALAGTTTTDANGLYRFDRLQPGTTYAVCVDAGGPLAGFELTPANVGANDAIDSDAALSNGVPCIASAPTGAAGSFIPTYDFGFWKPAAIGDRVWEDSNHNGIQDAGEHGVGGVGVALHDSTGAVIGHTVTDANGLYIFDRLPPGTYNVCFEVGTIPSGFSLTTKDASGSTRANGSDAGSDGCAVSTVLAPGQRDLDWDAGIWKAPPPSGGGTGPASPGKPKLSLKKAGKPATVRAGESIHYTLVVTNVGRATAHGVKVCDNLPDGVTVVSTGSGTLSGAQVCWTVGVLAKHKHRQFTLLVKVDLTQRKRLVNKAVATSDDTPPARAASSTDVTLPRSRHGVAGVTG